MKLRALTAVLLATLVAALATEATLAGGSGLRPGVESAVAAVPAPLGEARGAVAAARANARPPGHLTARISRPVQLRARPEGRIVAKVEPKTEFGSPTVFGVVEERGDWLGVTSPALPNGAVGWVRRSAVATGRVRVSLHADLSERTLELRAGGRTIRRLDVAVGRPGSPTPTGRFAVTDKLRGTDFGPYYGCCVIAISATQPNTPAGWQGGNRMAIHGTNSPGTIGENVSAGCLRAADGDLEVLMRRVPAGTPVFIRG